MKMSQNALAMNKSKSGGSKLPKASGKGAPSMKSLNQTKVAGHGVHAKKMGMKGCR